LTIAIGQEWPLTGGLPELDGRDWRSGLWPGDASGIDDFGVYRDNDVRSGGQVVVGRASSAPLGRTWAPDCIVGRAVWLTSPPVEDHLDVAVVLEAFAQIIVERSMVSRDDEHMARHFALLAE
jgi:hypothetical protein